MGYRAKLVMVVDMMVVIATTQNLLSHVAGVKQLEGSHGGFAVGGYDPFARARGEV